MRKRRKQVKQCQTVTQQHTRIESSPVRHALAPALLPSSLSLPSLALAPLRNQIIPESLDSAVVRVRSAGAVHGILEPSIIGTRLRCGGMAAPSASTRSRIGFRAFWRS